MRRGRRRDGKGCTCVSRSSAPSKAFRLVPARPAPTVGVCAAESRARSCAAPRLSTPEAALLASPELAPATTAGVAEAATAQLLRGLELPASGAARGDIRGEGRLWTCPIDLPPLELSSMCAAWVASAQAVEMWRAGCSLLCVRPTSRAAEEVI